MRPHTRTLCHALILALTLGASTARAEEMQKIPTARLDLTSGLLLTRLPHGQPFHLMAEAGAAHASTDELLLELYRADDGRCPSLATMRKVRDPDEDYISRSARQSGDPKGFTFALPALRYATPYCLYITQRTPLTFDTLLDAIRARQGGGVTSADWFMAGFSPKTYIVQPPRGELRPLRDALRDWIAKNPKINEHINRTSALNPRTLQAHTGRLGQLAPTAELLKLLDARGFDTTTARALAGAWSDALTTAKKEGFSEASLRALKAVLVKIQAAAPHAQTPAPTAAPNTSPTPPVTSAAVGVTPTAAPTPTAAQVAAGSGVAGATRSFMIPSAVANAMDAINTLLDARVSQDAASLGTLRASFNARFASTALVQVLTSSASTDALNYTERAGWYLSFDVGVLAPLLGESSATVTPYFGLNFYFAPVDKDVPLSVDGGLSKRFSIVAGVTLGEVIDASGSIQGTAWKDSQRALLLGAGLRVTDYVRAGAGALFVRQADPNPVVDRRYLRLAPFISLSVDVDLIGLVQSAYSKTSAAF